MLPWNAVGCQAEDLDTPALLVDLPTLESNIQRMAKTMVHEAGVQWRPHMKGIKTPALTQKKSASIRTRNMEE